MSTVDLVRSRLGNLGEDEVVQRGLAKRHGESAIAADLERVRRLSAEAVRAVTDDQHAGEAAEAVATCVHALGGDAEHAQVLNVILLLVALALALALAFALGLVLVLVLAALLRSSSSGSGLLVADARLVLVPAADPVRRFQLDETTAKLEHAEVCARVLGGRTVARNVVIVVHADELALRDALL